MTQISYITISLPITGKKRHQLLNFWQLSVPIFMTHSLLQQVKNSWIFNENTSTRVYHCLQMKMYALIGKYEKCDQCILVGLLYAIHEGNNHM